MNIKFMSKRFAENQNPDEKSCMISVRDPGERVRLKDWGSNFLSLSFEDYDPEELENFMDAELSLRKSQIEFFNEDHASRILNFIDERNGKMENIYIHCHAGVSRSAAVAKFLGEIFEVRPTHTSHRVNPNMHVYNTLRKVYEERKNA